MSQLCKQPTVHGKLLKKTSVELHTMEELKIKWDPDIEQPKIWMVFCEQPKQLGREGLSFQTIDQYYDWRSKIAKAPVFFTDYMARYKELTDYSTMSYFRFARVVHLQTERTLVADSRKHPGLSDTKAYKESELQAISQAKTLAYVERLNISPRLKELHYTSNSHIFLVEETGSLSLADWLDNYWTPDKLVQFAEKKLTIAVLMELAHRLFLLHDSGVIHGTLSRQNITVDLVSVTESPILEIRKVTSTFSDNRSALTGFAGLKDGTQKICFWFVGFQNAVILPKKINWNSIEMIQNHPDLYASPSNHESWIASASDVLALGIIFYEVVYGVNISETLNKEIEGDFQFVHNLLQHPQRYISLRAQTHRVGADVEELIAMMMSPSWEHRPSIKNVMEILMNLHVQASNPELYPSSNQIQEIENVDLDEPPLSREGTASVWKDQTIQKHISTSSNNPMYMNQPILTKFPSQQPYKTTKTNPFEDTQPQKLESFEIGRAPVLKPTMSENHQLRGVLTKNQPNNLLKRLHLPKQPLKAHPVSSNHLQPVVLQSDTLPQVNAPPEFDRANMGSKIRNKAEFKDLMVKPLRLMGSDDLKTPALLKITSGYSESIQGNSEIDSRGEQPRPPPRLVLSLQSSRNTSSVPKVCASGRSQFTPSNKLRRIFLPVGESMINSGVHIIDHLIGSAIDTNSKPGSNQSKPTLQVPRSKKLSSGPQLSSQS